jgi:hypothetical protein
MKLVAAAIGLPLKRHLASGPRHGRVHSVFRRSVNIICDDATWLSVHPAAVGMHPYAVRLESVGPNLSGYAGVGEVLLGASCREPVTAGPENIRFDRRSISIDLSNARAWDARVRPSDRGLDAGLVITQLRDLMRGRPVVSPFLKASLGVNGHRGDAWTAALNGLAAGIVRRVRGGLREGSVRDLRAGLAAAVGLGGGLTPSGDDFLTGLLGGLYCLGGREALREAVRAAVGPLLGRTSLESARMVEAAGRGLFPEALGDLLVSLGRGPAARRGKALEKLIRTGSGSGEDMLAGVLTCLEYIAGSNWYATH